MLWVQFPVEGGNFWLKLFKPLNVNSGLKCTRDLIVKNSIGSWFLLHKTWQMFTIKFSLNGGAFCRNLQNHETTKKSSSKMLPQWKTNPGPLTFMPHMLLSELSLRPLDPYIIILYWFLNFLESIEHDYINAYIRENSNATLLKLILPTI